MAVAEDPRDLISVRKVALLIGEILQLSNRVLPVSYATRVQVSHLSLYITTESDDTNVGAPSIVQSRRRIRFSRRTTSRQFHPQRRRLSQPKSISSPRRTNRRLPNPLKFPRRSIQARTTSTRIIANPTRDANRRYVFPESITRDASAQYEGSYEMVV